MNAVSQLSLKVVLTGFPEVGKTSIANRYTRNLFANQYISTMGCDFYIKKIHVSGLGPGAGGDIKLVIHDIGGSVSFASIRRKYMEGADIVFVVFALDDLHSYSIDEFLSDIDRLKDRPCVAFIGNKLDLVGLDSLDLSSIEAKAASIGARLFLTSAKENIAVSDVFVSTVEQFMSERFD